MKNFNIGYLITAELQKLIVPKWYRYNYEQYLNFFPKLEKLQVLVLRTWCKNLRLLDVNGCSKLTDTGIEWLISKPTELSKTLEELLVNCAAITNRGIKMAVENFPALKVVANGSTFDVLVEVAQSAAQAQPHKNSSFTRLAIHSAGVYTSGQLGSVVRYCPSLFEIIIEVKVGLTDTDLFCLTSLKNLQILKLEIHHQSNNGREITFDKGLVPVLKVTGDNVINLMILCLTVFYLKRCDGFGRQLHRSVSMITQPLAQHLRSSQEPDGSVTGVSQRRRTSSADEQGIDGGLALLRSPSKALQDTVKLMSGSHDDHSATQSTLLVLDFVLLSDMILTLFGLPWSWRCEKPLAASLQWRIFRGSYKTSLSQCACMIYGGEWHNLIGYSNNIGTYSSPFLHSRGRPFPLGIYKGAIFNSLRMELLEIEVLDLLNRCLATIRLDLRLENPIPARNFHLLSKALSNFTY
ncbi:hypothetical protein DAPPUDRAFT_240613 [Daphnia pulex]|uniref:F-box domain-containing protein n=1 Tax=Daphnia pulex TaxID=6669 RepID=E9GBY8_DAPPU|nr:hypothetical protein DAPPUDRAFT_240613 [Daphnia pulex]|eukprot:EFX83072.1 hypothetical protein DAPPUDRAFT_240613 [Daphnia pulex]